MMDERTPLRFCLRCVGGFVILIWAIIFIHMTAYEFVLASRYVLSDAGMFGAACANIFVGGRIIEWASKI
jgi:hypothetical protein